MAQDVDLPVTVEDAIRVLVQQQTRAFELIIALQRRVSILEATVKGEE